MPAHITHRIFARRVIQTAIEKSDSRSAGEIVLEQGNYLTLGAQGPDMFLHNQRTRPSCFTYGRLLHTRGYGRFIRCMTERLEKNSFSGDNPDAAARETAFLLAYATHAVLDRHTHPFIIYFSGWVDPKDQNTKKYHQAHAFYERILDVLTLHHFTHERITDYDFFSLVDCGEKIPPFLREMLKEALLCAYKKNPGGSKADTPEALSEKVSNAYLDTMFFYRLTNPPARENFHKAYHLDKAANFSIRYLALFHPRVLRGDIDFLNEARAPWENPCKSRTPSERGEIRRESFFDLFAAAEKEAVKVVERLITILKGDAPAAEIEELLGNGNLNDGTSEKPCVPITSKPLPLPELIDDLYESFNPG